MIYLFQQLYSTFVFGDYEVLCDHETWGCSRCGNIFYQEALRLAKHLEDDPDFTEW